MDKVTVSRAAQGLAHAPPGRPRRASRPTGASHVLALTPEGRRLYAEVAPLALAYEAALLEGMAAGEVEDFKRLLQRLQAAAGRLSDDAAG